MTEKKWPTEVKLPPAWVLRDPEGRAKLVREVNAALREGRAMQEMSEADGLVCEMWAMCPTVQAAGGRL